MFISMIDVGPIESFYCEEAAEASLARASKSVVPRYGVRRWDNSSRQQRSAYSSSVGLTPTPQMPDMDLCERKERAMVVECVGDEGAGGSEIVQYL